MKIRGFEKISLDQFKKDMNGYDNVEDLYNNIILPVRKTMNSVGYDLATPFSFEIKPNEIVLIPTGLKVYFQSDEMCAFYVRSSIGFKHNIRLVNQVGIFESDYYNNESNEGHIMIKIQNHGAKAVMFEAGDRIVQGVFSKYLVADDDNATGTRVGGLGSTGKGN